MKTRLSLLKAALYLCAFAVSLFIPSKTSFAAEAEKEIDGVTLLSKDTVYEYDLNGDGTTEKIRYQLGGNEDDYKTELKLYINDKLLLSKEDSGFSFRVQLLDLDASDNYLDFFICTTMESDCKKSGFFIRYDGTKLFDKITFALDKLMPNFSTYRYSIDKTNEDGTFTVVIDTPSFSDAIGCYYCYVSFQLKDKTISVIPTQFYNLTKECSEYQYKAAKSFSVYAKAGSKKVVYKVKKGDKITFDQMYLSKSGKVYFKAKNSKGKKGWIKSDQENLFSNCLYWG